MHLGVWMRRIPVTENPSNWVFNHLMDQLHLSYELKTIIATIIIATIASLISSLVVKYRMNPNGQLFAGVFFIILSGLHPETLALTPTLLASLFFVIAIYNVLNIYNKKSTPLQLFNFGAFTAIASLIYMPYYIMILAGIIALLIFKGFSFREFLQILLGFVNIYFLFIVIIFKYDLITEFYDQQVSGYFSPYLFSMTYHKKGIIALSILLITSIFVFISLYVFQIKRNIAVQKYYDFFFWTLSIGLLSVFWMKINEISHLHIFILPLSVLTGMMIAKIKNQLLAETIHLTFVISALFLQFQNW